jgi:hypothetical protein
MFKHINVLSTTLRVFENGIVERLKKNKWKLVKNTANHSHGYNVIMINKKQFMRSRIVCEAFMQFDVNGPLVVHHKDGDKLNCDVSNLSLELHSSSNSHRRDFDESNDHKRMKKDNEDIKK